MGYSLSVELISSDLNAEGQLIALNSDLEVLNYIACNEDLITAFERI